MGATLHILVVDDRPDSVLFLTEFLLSRRHRVETSNHASEALEAIVRRHRTADAYDLLISDVSMPGMDGLTLLKEIRRRQLLLPVALYTAYGAMHPNLGAQAQQLGCLAVLDKPIELRRVENLLDEVAARRGGTARTPKDEPFFGTSRVARTSTTTAYRKETAQPSDLDAPQSGGYALEPKPVIPLPPSQPLTAPSLHAPVPLPPPPPPRIPPPIRTPLPFPVEQQEPHTRSMPSFRTPLPHDRQDGTGRTVNPAFRTPLPFLQPGAVTTPGTPPQVPPSVAAAPQVRTPQPGAGAPASDVPAVPVRPTTSFIRRGVEPPTKATTGYRSRPSGLFLHSTNADPAQPPAIPPGGTARIRRTVTGSYAPSPITAGHSNPQARPPANPGTTAGNTASNSRAVACAHCRKVFMVASRPDAYTAVCVHCGQLNRIDPL